LSDSPQPGIELRPGVNGDALTRWEDDLANQPISRLLPLLESDNTICVRVVALAIHVQLQRGRFVGWPGKYEPVKRIDAVGVSTIRRALDRDLPVVVAGSLLELLERGNTSLDDRERLQMLLSLATNRNALVRERSALALYEELPLDSDVCVAHVEKLLKDSAPIVRRSAVLAVVDCAKHALRKTLPDSYQNLLRGAMHDTEWEVRAAAAATLPLCDLESDVTYQATADLLRDPQFEVRKAVVRALFRSQSQSSPIVIPRQYLGLLTEMHDDVELRREILANMLGSNVAPVEFQWAAVERELKTPNSAMDAGWFASLFAPEQGKPTSLPGNENPKTVRTLLRPIALEKEPSLIAWANEVLETSDETLSPAAIDILTYTGQAQAIRPALHHSSPAVRSRALQAFTASYWRVTSSNSSGLPVSSVQTRWLGLHEDLLERVIELLRDPDQEVRRQASLVASTWDGPLAHPNVLSVVAVIRESAEQDVILPLCHLLRIAIPEDPETKRLAVELLDHELPVMRNAGVDLLCLPGELPPDVLRRLLAGIRSGQLEARTSLLQAIGRTKRPFDSVEDARTVIMLLIRFYYVTTPDYRARAEIDIEKLFRLCPADAIGPALVEGITDENETVRQHTAMVIAAAQIDSDVLLPSILDLLSAESWKIRHGAAIALQAMHAPSPPVINALIGRLKDDEPKVRIAAAETLGSFGADAGSVAAEALALMARRDPFPGGQAAAVEALGQLHSLGIPWVETVRELANSNDVDIVVRMTAAAALKALMNVTNPP
jgi:HEAT repeat protein